MLPSGLIIVHSGILPVASNDDGLATVLGHGPPLRCDVADACRDLASDLAAQRRADQQPHGPSRAHAALTRQLYTGVTWAVSLLIDPNLAQFSNAATGILLELPNSRTMEAEADQNGLMLMVRVAIVAVLTS